MGNGYEVAARCDCCEDCYCYSPCCNQIFVVLSKILQFIHLFIVSAIVSVGIYHFIKHPPFFDGFGVERSTLPDQLTIDNPWLNNEHSTLRLIDLPNLAILIGYAGVCIWLKFKSTSWILSICMSIIILEYMSVHFWAESFFDWRFYDSRLIGLQIQITTLAFCATMILMALFVKRKKMPFKFKSSIPAKHMSCLHVAYNFLAILIITSTCLLLWFTKMYISWACFRTHGHFMKLCEITTQVQCYPCNNCTLDGLRMCYNDTKNEVFSCDMRYSSFSSEESFCVFNFNLSSFKFLTIFSFIGGLSVFLSTFIRIIGHYIVRSSFKIYGKCLGWFNLSSDHLRLHKEKVDIIKDFQRRSWERFFTQEVDDSSCSLVPLSHVFEDMEYMNNRKTSGFFHATCG